jgi:hypothetical protein
VTRYSNTASFLGVLAPAHRAYTTDIVGAGGYSSGDYDTSFGGTSAACPYAAGAVAALQSAARSALGRFLTPAEVRATLVNTGDPILDTKTPITKPRVNLGHAIESLGQSGSFTIFNDGNATLNVISISLETAAPWISWTPEPPFTIAAGDAQVVGVSIDPALAPFGESTRRLLVTSSDSDESPYPGGVFITVNKPDTRPSLRATRTGNKVVLSWPTNNSSGFLLQCATNLSSPGWTTIADVPAVISGEKVVTNNISGERKFFRLRQ